MSSTNSISTSSSLGRCPAETIKILGKRKDHPSDDSQKTKLQRISDVLTLQVAEQKKILSSDVVTLIASYEDFSGNSLPTTEQRIIVLFHHFCGSYSPKDLQLALQLQICDLSAPPNDNVTMGWYVGAKYAQKDPYYFHYLERRVIDYKTLALVCNRADQIWRSITKKGGVVDFNSASKGLESLLPHGCKLFRDAKFAGNQLALPKKMVTMPSALCSDYDIPILRVVLEHFPHDPLCVIIATEDGEDFVVLKPSPLSWTFEFEEESLDVGLTEPFCRTLISCSVKVPPEVLTRALWNSLFYRSFNKDYAQLLVSRGASIDDLPDLGDGFAAIWNSNNSIETQNLLLQFLLSYELNSYALKEILMTMPRPISPENLQQIFDHGKKYPENFIETMNLSFYQFCEPEPPHLDTRINHFLFDENRRDEIIFASSLLNFWLEIDPKAKEGLPTLYFMSFLKKNNPITEILEKSQGVVLKSVTKEMISSLAQWFRKIHIQFLDEEKDIENQETIANCREAANAFFYGCLENLLDQLEKRGIRLSREELVESLLEIIID